MISQNRPVVAPKTPLIKRSVVKDVQEAVVTKAPEAVKKAEKPLIDIVLVPLFKGLHAILNAAPGLNRALGHITGPIVKRKFNPPPGTVEPPTPAVLEAKTIEDARALMAKTFNPAKGKVVIGISGGGPETVHCFVVSGVKPDGQVMITQALAQATGPKEDYSGIGGHIQKWLDKALHNNDRKMAGVVEENWSDYAKRSHRNSIVVMELDADPAKIKETLAQLKTFVGRPYDHTMLAATRGSAASNAEMFCTEVSSWFVNELKPGTIQQSASHGWSVYQVVDHMKATDVHGGPLKVLFNGQNRLDIKALNPVVKFTGEVAARGAEKKIVESVVQEQGARVAAKEAEGGFLANLKSGFRKLAEHVKVPR